jgi:hypothetical protein
MPPQSTGTGSAQTITNGIDLAGEGGMVWTKSRTLTYNNTVGDTENGVNLYLYTNTSVGHTDPTPAYISAYRSNGYTIGGSGFVASELGASGVTYASWTFRKAPRFFDCVTWTGDGNDSRAIAHSLGIAPGFIMVKRTDSDDDWVCFHRLTVSNTSIAWQYTLNIGQTNAFFHAEGSAGRSWGGQNPDDTNFYVDDLGTRMNENGGTYVAYLFAHDPLGPSGDGSDGLIACGSFIGGGDVAVDIGWEPQWVLTKATGLSQNWTIHDTMRGYTADPVGQATLHPNLSDAEDTGIDAALTSTGFRTINSSTGQNYIYVAIRRGPMRAPTSGTEVFATETQGATGGNPSFRSGFPVDLGMYSIRSGGGTFVFPRLTSKVLQTFSTDPEGGGAAPEYFQFNNGWINNSNVNTNLISWMFRRAPGFFDVVAYEGTSNASTVFNHNLGVIPEMSIIKNRDGTTNWKVYHKGYPTGFGGHLNSNIATDTGTTINNLTENTFTVNVAGIETNTSGYSYIAYLFATLPGVSKVGSYTGTGAAFNVDCGFTTGARFVLIKKTSNTGDWGVFDTARGITESSSPLLRLNNTTAEANFDYLDPYSGGFAHSGANATFNASGDTYIFLAIA